MHARATVLPALVRPASDVDVVDRPCEVALQVWTVLTSRGYAEPVVRCRHCQPVPARP